MKRKILIVILAITAITTSAVISGCGCQRNTVAATNDTAPTKAETIEQIHNTNETVPTIVNEEKQDAVQSSGLKVDTKTGKVTDKDGNEVKTDSDGNVTVTNSKGETVKVNTSEINTVNNKPSTSSSQQSAASSSSKTSSSTSKPNSAVSTPSSSQAVSTTKAPHEGKTWHEAVYEAKTTPAVMGTRKVLVSKAYEKPVYEEQCRCICNDCGADLTDMTGEDRCNHCGDHLDNGGKGSWSDRYIEVQVGTKTVPAVYKDEQYVITPAKTEKVLVKEAGWY